MGVDFENNTFQVTKLLKEKAVQFLHEAGGEVEAQVKRNTRVDKGQTKSSFRYVVDESEMKVIIGSPDENALWEEFGTGQYALEGRKTPWFIPVDKYYGKKKPTFQGKVVVVYGKEGQAFYKTDGKKPTKALYNAIEKSKPKLKKRLETLMKEG